MLMVVLGAGASYDPFRLNATVLPFQRMSSSIGPSREGVVRATTVVYSNNGTLSGLPAHDPLSSVPCRRFSRAGTGTLADRSGQLPCTSSATSCDTLLPALHAMGMRTRLG